MCSSIEQKHFRKSRSAFFLLKSPIFNNTQGTSDSLYQVGCLSACVQGVWRHLTEKWTAAHFFFFDNHSFIGCLEAKCYFSMDKREDEILKELRYQNKKKNILVSLLLVIIFGPLGLFYVNIPLAIGLFIVIGIVFFSLFDLIIGNPTIFGILEYTSFFVFFCVVYFIVLIILSVTETNKYNENLRKSMGLE